MYNIIEQYIIRGKDLCQVKKAVNGTLMVL